MYKSSDFNTYFNTNDRFCEYTIEIRRKVVYNT